jgi:hypothetical protein
MGWVVSDIPRPLYPRERSDTHCIEGWVGHRAGLDGAENLAPTGIRSTDRPARSKSLYRLRYVSYIQSTLWGKFFMLYEYNIIYLIRAPFSFLVLARLLHLFLRKHIHI